MRKLIFGTLAAVLVAASCAQGVEGAQTYTVGVDAASPEGENLQYSTYFPSTVKASPGDSIVFENNSTQAPHTITFGVKADRSNQPTVVLPDGSESPVVQEPCYSEDDPTPQLTTCPNKELPAYDGGGYWNSGFLNPAPAPAQAGPKEVTVELADSIEPGQYRYLCILHGPMAGVIEVVEEGERESAEGIAQQGREDIDKVKSDADAIRAPEVDAGVVAAGWSGGVTAVNRFAPETIEVKAGEGVSWEAFSDFEPHTVSFGTKFKSGVPVEGFTPTGARSGADYAADTSSGIFGKAGGPFPPGPFTLTFPTAGEYGYVCVLHPGMEGVVKVS